MSKPPDYSNCPKCNQPARCRIIRERRPKDISLDGPAQQVLLVGVYRCKHCQKYFTVQPQVVSPRKRYTDRARGKVYDGIVQDKLTFLASPRRASRDFSINPSLSSCWRWIQEEASSIDIANDYSRKVAASFSGQLSVDEVKDGDRRMFVATDPLQPGGPIISYHRADRANAEELTTFFKDLRDNLDISPKIVNHDDAAIFENTITEVWPEARPQLCHFHVIKRLSYAYLRKSLRDRLQSFKPTSPRRAFPRPLTTLSTRQQWQDWRARYRGHKKRWLELFRRRNLFLKSVRSLRKPDSIKRKEAEFIGEACHDYQTLATFRAFVLDFYAIMDSKDASAAEALRQAFLLTWAPEAKRDHYIRHVTERFQDGRWFSKLFAFTLFTNGARTTNSTERANRWFRKRQKSHYRTRKEGSTVNMLNADLEFKKTRQEVESRARTD